MAQVPTNFGTNAEDGIIYQTYNLIDHGVVSSVRFQAQNTVPEGQGTWEFFTGSYDPVWRPYAANDTLSAFNTLIDPALESASARFNTQAGGGGAIGLLPAVQAGYYYTAIVQTGTADNFMSIVETDFQPVAIDTVYITPANPTLADDVTFTVELDGFNSLSPGEHVFIRASPDFSIQSSYVEVTNFSNGTGTAIVSAGSIPAGIPIQYYALVTAEADPEAVDDIDYFTLYFANNSGANFQFTVSSVTGIEDVIADFGVVQTNGTISVRNASELTALELISMDGKVVYSEATSGSLAQINTTGMTKGVYVLNLLGNDNKYQTKLFID